MYFRLPVFHESFAAVPIRMRPVALCEYVLYSIVRPRLHDTTGCQTGYSTGLTNGCIVLVGFNKPSALASNTDWINIVCIKACASIFICRCRVRYSFAACQLLAFAAGTIVFTCRERI